MTAAHRDETGASPANGPDKASDPTAEDRYYELPEVLLDELKEIDRAKGKKRPDAEYAVSGEDRDGRLRGAFSRLHQAKSVALCLSGGGIRSATFNLGVLQGLARNGVLKEVDYLSTVSGGGYIGSWFSSWIARGTGSDRARMEKVVDTLAQESPNTGCSEPYQVKFLRDYSNYLTPRVGILSVDTWAIIGTYLRNLLLNWLVLVPLFFALLLLPRIICGLLSDVTRYSNLADPLLGAGAVLGILPIAYTVADLPSVGNQKGSKGLFAVFFLAPLVLMAGALSAFWICIYRPGCSLPEMWQFLVFGALVHIGGWLLGILYLLLKKRAPGWLTVVISVCCAAVTGVVAGFLAYAAAVKLVPALLQWGASSKYVWAGFPKLIYATASVPILLGVYLLTGVLVVALLSPVTGEEDREWWGRSAGVIMLSGVVWFGAMALVIYGPWLILPDSTGFWKEGYAAVGGISGIVAAVLGKNAATPALRPGVSMNWIRTSLPAAAAGLFLLFLAQVLSLSATALITAGGCGPATTECLSKAAIACTPFPVTVSSCLPLDFHSHLSVICNTPTFTVFCLAVAAAALCLLAGYPVDVNKFSMHAMYRNRLVRCYLGASREKKERDPNPFTGFDRDDIIAMKDLARRPFHVVNMAWNLVKGERLAWQQRKAASFTVSPLFAGGDLDAPLRDGCLPGGFRSARVYAAGTRRRRHPMTVGTAMAISGAAASPNMGYHSSPLVTFVMSLFNVRLGWWLGNPGTGLGTTWKGAPGFAVGPLLMETFGLTKERSSVIYLSDGGHFENLGLYEMVRRRCRYIIVGDASCDCDTTFQDLGNAVRKVRADFGIDIEIDLKAVRAKKLHFAVGTVRYMRCDDPPQGGREDESYDGKLLYIKPVLTDDETVDDYNYAKMHPEFPHETTADQWFDEAQFESYRKLGLHSIESFHFPAGGWSKVSVPEIFDIAQRMHDEALDELPGPETGAKPA